MNQKKRIGAGFFSKTRLAEAKAQREQSQRELDNDLPSVINNIIEVSNDIKRERQQLISSGKDCFTPTKSDFEFFSQLQNGVPTDYNGLGSEFGSVECEPLRKLSVFFDRKLGDINHPESTKHRSTFPNDYKTDVNKKYRQLTKNNKNANKIKTSDPIHLPQVEVTKPKPTGGTMDETIENDNVSVDKIKGDLTSDLGQWKRHRIYLDLIYNEFEDDFNKFNESDFDFLKKVYNWNDFHKPCLQFFYKKYGTTIMYIPSGGGKTTLYNKYKAVFFDIDQLLWYENNHVEMAFFVRLAKEKGDWTHVNNFWQYLIYKYRDVINGRILLCHVPDQVPPKLRKICKELILIPKDITKLRESEANIAALMQNKSVPIIKCYRSDYLEISIKFSKINKLYKFDKPFAISKFKTRLDNNNSSSNSYETNINDLVSENISISEQNTIIDSINESKPEFNWDLLEDEF
jgi:hypothetical protein